MRIDYQNAILLVLCLILLLSVFSLSASAVSPNDELPVVDGTVASMANAMIVGTGGGDTFYYGASHTGVFVGRVGSGLSFISKTDADLYSTTSYNGGSLNTPRLRDMTARTVSGQTYYLYSIVHSGMTPSSNIPVYASDDAFALQVLSYVPPVPASPLDYSLPPGNVAYIPIPSGQSSAITYTLTTTYYMAFGNNDTSRINQVVTVMSSLPSSTNNTAPSAPKIPWTNNGNVNLLGVSANKIYQGSIPANYGGQYLVVVNPMTMPSQTGLIGGDTYTNGSINISVSAVSGSPHIYPMSESLTITPGDGIGSESSYGDSGYTYEIDPETGEIIWTDPEGGSSAPVAGGNNPMPSPNTIFDWLRNISQQFSDFLRGPVQAVQVVVSAIRDFLGSFTQLYQWLPSPVYSLITSALMIALTIGVIKIFV